MIKTLVIVAVAALVTGCVADAEQMSCDDVLAYGDVVGELPRECGVRGIGYTAIGPISYDPEDDMSWFMRFHVADGVYGVLDQSRGDWATCQWIPCDVVR